MARVKTLNGVTVYQVGQFGQYAGDKAGKPCCWKKTITDSFNTGHGSHWVNRDDTGKSWRLVLDGTKSDFVAQQTPEGYELPSGISLAPVGEILGS